MRRVLCERATVVLAILPAAAFQAALPGRARVFEPRELRLKAGRSQDWLPHNYRIF